MDPKRKNLLLVSGAVGMAVLALAIRTPRTQCAFAGTDDQARETIVRIDPTYKPWFSPWWEPPSPEISALLFGLQAALGAGVVGYALGFWKGSRKGPHA